MTGASLLRQPLALGIPLSPWSSQSSFFGPLGRWDFKGRAACPADAASIGLARLGRASGSQTSHPERQAQPKTFGKNQRRNPVLRDNSWARAPPSCFGCTGRKFLKTSRLRRLSWGMRRGLRLFSRKSSRSPRMKRYFLMQMALTSFQGEVDCAAPVGADHRRNNIPV